MTGFRILLCVTWHLWQRLLEAECLMAKASCLGAPEVLDPVSQGQGPLLSSHSPTTQVWHMQQPRIQGIFSKAWAAGHSKTFKR
jgi:hypothetical protein